MCEAKLNLAKELNSEFENWVECEKNLDLHEVFYEAFLFWSSYVFKKNVHVAEIYVFLMVLCWSLLMVDGDM
jgi:hypothetical protein